MAIDSHMHLNSSVLENVQKHIEDINKNQTIRNVINVGLNIKTSKESTLTSIKIQSFILQLEFTHYILISKI